MSKTLKQETSSQTRVWTPAQVAAMLHVSVTTVRKAIEAGQLKAMKVNGDYQISEESMNEFLKAGNPFSRYAETVGRRSSGSETFGQARVVVGDHDISEGGQSMYIYKHLTVNNVKIEEFPFRRELAMEAYILENEEILSLGVEGFEEVSIVASEVVLLEGRRVTDGRIDILTNYGQEYIGIVELKLGKLTEEHFEQLKSYLEAREQILGRFSDIWDFESNPLPKWIGVMVGQTIDPDLAGKIRRGLYVDNNIPIAALTINRFRGEDGQIYVITDSYFVERVRGKDYRKYRFEGKTYHKNRLVHAVVSAYVQGNLNVTYAELKNVFPDRLQGSRGVFIEAQEAEKHYIDTGRPRYFLKPSELLSLSDVIIAVCNQWGVGNIERFIEHAEGLGFEIEEAQ